MRRVILSTLAAALAPMVSLSGGELAILRKDGPKQTLTPVGLYHMPFGLEVDCPTCP